MRIRLALLLGVLPLMLFGGLFTCQRRLLHHPDLYPLEDLQSEAAASRLELWPSPADYRGLLASPAAPPRGTVLVVHGNAGSAADRTWYLKRLVALGYRTLLLEYPGYGPRPGGWSEDELAGDLADSVVRAGEQFGQPLYLLGESLGAGVACAAVARGPEAIRGIILVTPWDSLATVAQHHFPFLPVRWLLLDRFDSVGNLKRFPGPVAFVVAEQDEVIPVSSTLNLHESYPGKKQLLRIPGRGHNTWVTATDARWWAELLEFVGSGSG